MALHFREPILCYARVKNYSIPWIHQISDYRLSPKD